MPLPRKIFRQDVLMQRIGWYKRLKHSLPPRELRGVLRFFTEELLKEISRGNPKIQGYYITDLSKASKEQKRKAWKEFQRELTRQKYYGKKLIKILKKKPELVLEKWRSIKEEIQSIEKDTLRRLKTLGIKYVDKEKTIYFAKEYLPPDVKIKSYSELSDKLMQDFSKLRLAFTILDSAIEKQHELVARGNFIADLVWIEKENLAKKQREKAEEVLKIMSKEASTYTALYNARRGLEMIISRIGGALGLH